MADDRIPEDRRNDSRAREESGSRGFLQLAEEYRRNGRTADAIDILREGLEGHPTYVAAKVALGRCLLEVGDAGEARTVLLEVAEKDMTHMVASKLLVEAHIALGDSAAARQQLELYSVLNASDPEIDALRARINDPAAPAAASEPEAESKEEESNGAGASDSTPLAGVAKSVRLGTADPFPTLLHPESDRFLSGLAAEGIFALPVSAGEEPEPAESPEDPAAASVEPLAAPEEPPAEEPFAEESAAEEPADEPEPEPSLEVADDGASEPEPSDDSPNLGAAALAGAAGLATMAVPALAPEPDPEPEPPASDSSVGAGETEPTATLGELYLEQGHHDEAERIFRALLEKDPADSRALRGLELVQLAALEVEARATRESQQDDPGDETLATLSESEGSSATDDDTAAAVAAADSGSGTVLERKKSILTRYLGLLKEKTAGHDVS